VFTGTKSKTMTFRSSRFLSRPSSYRQDAAPVSTEGRSQRALPLWQRKEIQALLRQPIAGDTLIRVKNFPLRR
jgi:hypothetical protein